MERKWREMGEVFGCVMDWMMNNTCGWERERNMDSFCERKRMPNAMEWRGRMSVDDNQKWCKNGVCNRIIPREK